MLNRINMVYRFVLLFFFLSSTVKATSNPTFSQIRAVAGQRSSPALCFATKSIKSMTKDIDLNVTRVGRDTSDQYLPTCYLKFNLVHLHI